MMYKKLNGQLYAVKEGDPDADLDDHGPYDKIINCLGFQVLPNSASEKLDTAI